MTVHEPSLKDEIAAAMDWWREAGVDADFSDDATDWLAEAEPQFEVKAVPAPSGEQAVAQEPEKQTAVDLIGDNPPSDLVSFREFWLNEAKLSLAGNAPRVAPRGDAEPKLMVIVATPEQGDSDTLLSGPQGQLLAKILAAMGLGDAEVYFASAAPQALPLADGRELHRAGLAKLLELHVKLVCPERLLIFGTNILPLVGHDAAQQPETVHEFASGDEAIPLLVTEGLDNLAGMPRLKARFWRRWLAHLVG